MIKDIVRQTWQLARTERLYTAIYVMGTALAVASITIFAVIYYVRLAPVYPETNRDKTYYATSVCLYNSDGHGMQIYGFSQDAFEKYVRKVKNATVVSGWNRSWGDEYVNTEDGKYVLVSRLQSDPQYFQIYDYDFVEGRPFNDDEHVSGAKVAVISDRLAQRLWGDGESAVGRDVTVEFTKYRVVGVFKEGSAINEMSYANVITPYTASHRYSDPGWYGDLSATFLSDNPEALREEFKEFERAYNSAPLDTRLLRLYEQPISHIRYVLTGRAQIDLDVNEVLKHFIVILLVLLLVPALNISGLITSRMQSRTAEMGVRKAFGATRSSLLSRVMSENMMLTLAGGILGLVITWLMLYVFSDWIFFMLREKEVTGDVTLNPDMLFAPAVFGVALLTCFVLNTLAGLIPAWRSLRKPIVNSLKQQN